MIIKTIYVCPETEITYFASAEYHKGRMGRRNGFDRFAEPDEPDEIDNVIIFSDGGEVTVDDDELYQKICNALICDGEVDEEEHEW